MPQLVYRIQKSRFVPTLLSGEGARLYGGRWNPEGTPLIYTSASPELAFLETLVHLDATPFSDLPPYVQVILSLPDNSVEVISEAELPPYWDDIPSPDHVARFLQPRLQAGNQYLGFAVPSSVLRGSPSRNILLNPLHPLIKQVEIVSVTPFVFDERLRPEPVKQALPTKPSKRTSTKRKPNP